MTPVLPSTQHKTSLWRIVSSLKTFFFLHNLYAVGIFLIHCWNLQTPSVSSASGVHAGGYFDAQPSRGTMWAGTQQDRTLTARTCGREDSLDLSSQLQVKLKTINAANEVPDKRDADAIASKVFLLAPQPHLTGGGLNAVCGLATMKREKLRSLTFTEVTRWIISKQYPADQSDWFEVSSSSFPLLSAAFTRRKVLRMLQYVQQVSLLTAALRGRMTATARRGVCACVCVWARTTAAVRAVIIRWWLRMRGMDLLMTVTPQLMAACHPRAKTTVSGSWCQSAAPTKRLHGDTGVLD